MKEQKKATDIQNFSSNKEGMVTAISEYNFGKASANEMNEFIETMSYQLAGLARETGNEFLVYLLMMAAQEANLERMQSDVCCTASAS